ncbi:rhomboid family intramembrane serine protease [Aliiroseovarius crassostreae]|uniref:rhomboid family intramembrane serine protease n=1 Tax=Aliiroseovarius crassostreae TaxID=154981 RepID=UPI002205B037|nr:rhomboid family intramembrane serine protease [Aliiroseovarius crassostreae]UWP89866.1 rhomboid family intramembrane serine protease [Aliiroseovarius crassostreae]
MIPIRDHNPSLRVPYVTFCLLGVNLMVFLAMWPLRGNEAALAQVYYGYGAVPHAILQGEGWSSLFTSMFVHGGFLHFAGNMLFLWIFGDNLEDILGHLRFLLFYLAAGVGATLLQVLVDPASTIPIVGASGAIAGIMGGYLLLFPRAQVDVLFIIVIFFKVIPFPAWLMLLIWLALQLWGGVASLNAQGGVAYWAHIGGFAVGFVAMLPFWYRLGGPEYWRITFGHPDHPVAHYRFQKSRIPQVRRSDRGDKR